MKNRSANMTDPARTNGNSFRLVSKKKRKATPLFLVLFALLAFYVLWVLLVAYVTFDYPITSIESPPLQASSSKTENSIELPPKHEPNLRSPTLGNEDIDITAPQKPTKKEEPFSIDSIPPRKMTLIAYMEPAAKFYNETDFPSNEDEVLKRWESIDDHISPLPLRTHTPSDLKTVSYPKVRSCSDLPHNLPVDPGMSLSSDNKPILTNVANKSPIYPDRLAEYLKFCPVDSDPFLPWIHDVFSSQKGDAVHVIAQNRRRCNNGQIFFRDIWNLIPQVSLMQPVAVTRVEEETVLRNNETKDLWHPGGEDRNTARYRLSTHEDADDDGQYTRFLCRFHSGGSSVENDGKEDTIVFGETLSTYPFNYELAHHRKTPFPMATFNGKDNALFWLSSLEFKCPVPEKIRSFVVNGMAEGRVFLDLVPIRTPTRVEKHFYHNDSGDHAFDAEKMWGQNHVLPRIEASGRWANVPVCMPHTPIKASSVVETKEKDGSGSLSLNASNNDKAHSLVACVYTSALYKTRANGLNLMDVVSRLTEWIEFHLLVGFDHFYVYDNSGADGSPNGDLSFVTEIFGSDLVTVIQWPFKVCNNNTPKDQNMGERSSQYAAESSCMARYGPHTDWMANFDPDEYIVPVGKYTDLKEMLRDAERGGTKIITFRSVRSLLNYNVSVPFDKIDECHQKTPLGNSPLDNFPTCLTKNPNRTYLETYSCEPFAPNLKPSWTERAKKQIFQPDYVLNHFVHYSTVTKKTISLDYRPLIRIHETKPTERWSSELDEAIMIHAKTMDEHATNMWFNRCKEGAKHKNHRDACNIAFQWPDNKVSDTSNTTSERWLYNCFKNEKVEKLWIPKLNDALLKRKMKDRE